MGGPCTDKRKLSASESGSATRRFTRQQRLLKPADFRRVFQDAVRAGNGCVTVLGRPNELGIPRLGLAISKKHLRTAVARNRVKRQIRESFRHNQNYLGGLDVVVLSRPGLAELPVAHLRKALDRHWHTLVKRCARSS